MSDPGPVRPKRATGSSPDFDELVFRALADPTRRQLLELLRGGPRTTGDLAACFDHTRFAVMKHLNQLVNAGLVLVERRGRERLNHLNPEPLQRIYRRWIRPFDQMPTDAVLRLKEHLENPHDR